MTPKGFMTTPRQTPTRRPVDLRLMDWREVYEDFPKQTLEKQAGRCMNCGIPFCHQGCPLGTSSPSGTTWSTAGTGARRSSGCTPRTTSRSSPGRCAPPVRAACVLAINDDAVTIKQVEIEIIDKAWDEGWVPRWSRR